jgi:8-oxo-dGTP pyrophosphatase MutT (NUDIX family)
VIEASILNRLILRLERALAPPSVPLCRFVVDGVLVGEVEPSRLVRLQRFTEVFVQRDGELGFVAGLRRCDARSAAIDRVARALAGEGALTAWRDERYAVAAKLGAPPMFLLERAAARYFGIATFAVHVNGTTRLGDGCEAMWLARRSPHKAIDPGLLDNMIGGGIAAHSTVRDTLIKEAREEAGLATALAKTAVPAGSLHIRRLHSDGLQRETIFVHDLELPFDVVPVNQDGEVTAFRLARPTEIAELAGNEEGADVVTADASLVMADWLVRRTGAPGLAELGRIAALCIRPLTP